MNNAFYDPIVAEVRRNRKELLADFGGDIRKLDAYIDSKQREREAAGVRYVTEEEMLKRLAWKKQQDEELANKIASM
ncbi:MAG: hypothetical protein LBL96_11375 [Clostridiales bacterium]|jgi:predicted house-cleaning NTP pyrophosphatase (Maf/HAM1 superfamily)|nr:hypothetical protein [Clostridiales bacterium]